MAFSGNPIHGRIIRPFSEPFAEGEFQRVGTVELMGTHCEAEEYVACFGDVVADEGALIVPGGVFYGEFLEKIDSQTYADFHIFVEE